MPPVQTTVTNFQPAGVPGMLYDNSQNDIVTCIATEAIPFGADVVINGATCSLPAAAADVTGKNNGFALMTQSLATGLGYLTGMPVPVLRSGRLWVQTEDAAAAGTAVNTRYTATGAGKGSSAGTAVASNTAVHQTAKFFLGNSAAGLAVVQVDGA